MNPLAHSEHQLERQRLAVYMPIAWSTSSADRRGGAPIRGRVCTLSQGQLWIFEIWTASH